MDPRGPKCVGGGKRSAPFPTASVATSGEAGPALEGEPVIRGQGDQGDTAGGSIENRQAEGNRGVTLGGQEGTPQTTASAATATPTTAMSAPSCEGEVDEAAARGIRGRPRGSGRKSRVASVGRGDGTSWRVCPRTGGSEPPSSEGGQSRRVVDTGAPCTYCGEDLDYSVGDPGDGQTHVPVTCPHGGYVHALCMWDRAESLANGHVDPHPCATCRSE